jgi:hypothetical protein
MRFSLKYLFLMTTLAGLACAVLLFANLWCGAVCFTASMGLILASVVLAYAATGVSRSFWIGFAIFGCGYWLALRIPVAGEVTAARWTFGSESPLITAQLLEWSYKELSQAIGPAVPDSDNFGRVGHSLFAILTAFLGGWLGRFAYRRYRSRAAQA